jgi:hypothetical protein
VAPGRPTGRLPTDRGFDEWRGVKNSLDEAGYTAWPLFKESGMPAPMIWEGKKGEPSKPVMPLDLNVRPILDGSYIIPKTVEYIKRNAAAKKPFFVYVGYSEVHPPTIGRPGQELARLRPWPQGVPGKPLRPLYPYADAKVSHLDCLDTWLGCPERRIARLTEREDDLWYDLGVVQKQIGNSVVMPMAPAC